ncbi:hypothetical protein SCA6_005089 [Theobroma cacao]
MFVNFSSSQYEALFGYRLSESEKVVVRGEEQDGAGSCCSSAVVQFRQCYFLPCTSRAKTNGPWVTNTS